MDNASLINQNSFSTEYYTPYYIIQRVHQVLGDIDLDPASSEIANKAIKAKKIFTVEDNGLSKTWAGRVWMNHPFSRGENKAWVVKFCSHYILKDITEGCCITYASTSESWFRPLLYFPQCFLLKRVNYVLPSGEIKKGVTKGSVITYIGQDLVKFYNCFADLGVVKVSLDYLNDRRNFAEKGEQSCL